MPNFISRNPFFFPIIFLLALVSTTAQAACTPALQGTAYDRAINTAPVDQNLFNSAVLYYTNEIRCRRGLSILQSTRDVLGAATTQATNMAQTRIYDHNLPVRGARNLRERMRAQTSDFRAAGENIAKNFVYVLNGRPYIPADNCAFRYLGNRQPVPLHTYRSLAQELVSSWESSPGHLVNIVNRRYTRMGAAFGLDLQGQLCGEIYATQVFAG